MKLLEIKYDKNNTQHYTWRRGISGAHHHWEMSVLHGSAILHIEGSRKTGYWGHIQLNNTYNSESRSIYSTRGYGLDLFHTPDDCGERLVVEWFKIIDGDSKTMLKGEFQDGN